MKPKDMREFTLACLGRELQQAKDKIMKAKTAYRIRPKETHLPQIYKDFQDLEERTKYTIQWLQDMKFNSEGY